MKKNYISPSVIAFEVKACNLLAGSPGIQSTDPAGPGTPENPINFGRGDDDNDW